MANRINLDVTDRLDITCRQGDTFELTLTLKDSSGTALPLDTDAYSFLMQVRGNKQVASQLRTAEPQPGTEDLIIGSSELGAKSKHNFTFKDIDDNGNVTVFLSASQMKEIPSGRYRYDFQYNVGDTQRTVLEGSFKVNADISKALS